MSKRSGFVEVIEQPTFKQSFVALSESAAANALSELAERFIEQPDSCWWWEHIRGGLPTATHTAPSDDGYRLLPSICPDGQVLFFVSDDEFPPWFGCRARPRDLALAIAECSAFEYVVADPAYEWMLMENHHGVLFAVGEPVATALAQHGG